MKSTEDLMERKGSYNRINQYEVTGSVADGMEGFGGEQGVDGEDGDYVLEAEDMLSPMDENNQKTVKKVPKSTSNLFEELHSGRPKDEEPHVKKTMKNKREKIEYITRVDLDELGIVEDEFEDLLSLFQLFDHDVDGVLSIREASRVIKCLGLPHDEDQICQLLRPISVDKTGFSVSFNEYLTFVSTIRRLSPDKDDLVQVLKAFDKEDTGTINEIRFRAILSTKEGVNDEEISSMIKEYFEYTGQEQLEEGTNDIDYVGFVEMLQS